MRLFGLAFVLVLLCLCATAAADEPVLTYVFSGQATRGGEPVKQGTIIEARVGGATIGATRVTDTQGNWSIEIDAGLFRSGICEAVFYIDGQQAGKQNVNCSVDLLLEVGPSATTGDKPTGAEPESEGEPNEPDSEAEPSDTEDQPVDTDPVIETETETESKIETGTEDEDSDDVDQTDDDVDHQDDADNPGDELTADDEPKENEAASTTTALRPNVPGTGSGGLAESPPWTAWGVLAIPLVSILGWLLWRARSRSFE